MESTPTKESTATDATGRLRGGALSTRHLVFFVVSAAAPLTTVVGYAGLSFMLGGEAAPVGYLVAGAVFALFAVGFTTMSRYIGNAGALYAYITRGLGRVIGSGAALVAFGAYTLFGIGFCAGAGFFAAAAFQGLFSITVPWGVCAVAIGLLSGCIAYRGVNVGARILGVFLISEITLLMVLSAAVLIQGTPEGISFTSFAPSTWAAASMGSLLVITFSTYMGFEQSAVYAEEVKDPRRAVPRATYVAVALLAIIYSFMMWIVLQAIGPHALGEFLSSGDPYTLVYQVSESYLGSLLTKVMEVLVVTSFLAGVLAFLNAGARYLFAMGRAGLMPAVFSKTSSASSPAVAVVTQTCLFVVPVAIAALVHMDPFTQVVVWSTTHGTLVVLTLQLLTSAAVIRFFLKQTHGESVWHRLIAPAVAGVLIAAVLLLMLSKMAGTTQLGLWGNVLILLPAPILFATGASRALIMRARQPRKYAQLGRNEGDLDEE